MSVALTYSACALHPPTPFARALFTDAEAKLAARNMSVASLHGELTKQQRQTTLAAFRRGAWPCCVISLKLGGKGLGWTEIQVSFEGSATRWQPPSAGVFPPHSLAPRMQARTPQQLPVAWQPTHLLDPPAQHCRPPILICR